jgi:hypothetical protein
MIRRCKVAEEGDAERMAPPRLGLVLSFRLYSTHLISSCFFLCLLDLSLLLGTFLSLSVRSFLSRLLDLGFR